MGEEVREADWGRVEHRTEETKEEGDEETGRGQRNPTGFGDLHHLLWQKQMNDKTF